MNTFQPGDKITPRGFSAWSRNLAVIVWKDEIVTVESERHGELTLCERRGSFLGSDFRRTEVVENQTTAPGAHVALWKRGDKITPKKGAVSSMDGGTAIAPRKVATIKEIEGDFLTVNECFGIFSVFDFALVRFAESAEIPPSPPRRPDSSQITPLTVPPLVPPKHGTIQQELQSRNRKAVKKKFERQFGTLEWRDGYLCYAGTANRIPDSPHVPNDKPPKKVKDPWD